MEETKQLENMMKFIEETMKKYPTHDIYHAKRVLKNCQDIMQKWNEEKLDNHVIYTAAIVHDFVDHKLCEDMEKQEERLRKELKDNGYLDQQIDHICYIIRHMSYSSGEIPSTIEGKIVQDADRLDSICAMAVTRPFTYAVEFKRPPYDDPKSSLSHYIEKKLKVEGLLNTKQAKEIAKKKGKITYLFLAYLLDELPEEIYEKKQYKKEIKAFYEKYNQILPEEMRR